MEYSSKPSAKDSPGVCVIVCCCMLSVVHHTLSRNLGVRDRYVRCKGDEAGYSPLPKLPSDISLAATMRLRDHIERKTAGLQTVSDMRPVQLAQGWPSMVT